MMKRYLVSFVIFFLLSGTVYTSDESVTVSKDNETVFLSLKIGIKNSKELVKRLSSGLSNKIVISVQIRDKKNNNPVFGREYIYEAVYDVWDEKYRLYSFDPHKKPVFETQDRDEAYRKFLNPEKIRLCEAKSLLPDSNYNIRVRVVVNPVSKDIIEKIKEYLADPEMGNKGSPTRTIFGSFANAFIPDLNTENIIKYEIKSINISEIPVIK